MICKIVLIVLIVLIVVVLYKLLPRIGYWCYMKANEGDEDEM